MTDPKNSFLNLSKLNSFDLRMSGKRNNEAKKNLRATMVKGWKASRAYLAATGVEAPVMAANTIKNNGEENAFLIA